MGWGTFIHIEYFSSQMWIHHMFPIRIFMKIIFPKLFRIANSFSELIIYTLKVELFWIIYSIFYLYTKNLATRLRNNKKFKPMYIFNIIFTKNLFKSEPVINRNNLGYISLFLLNLILNHVGQFVLNECDHENDLTSFSAIYALVKIV